jgi:sterol 3beta-glucosyltransferase
MITILAAGSRGDTQPYLALGAALKHAGHPVRIATFAIYEELVRGAGLELFPLSGDITQVVKSAAGAEAMQADNPLKVLRSFNTLKAFASGKQAEFYHACEGSNAVIFHPGPAIGYFIARKMKIPAILATPFPMTPTREYPSLISYAGPRLGKGYNLLTHKAFEQIMWSAGKSPTRDFWKKQFGKTPDDLSCPYGKADITVISCSNHVFPRPADWPDRVHQSGFWFLDEEPGWSPSSDLLDFLRGGEPPVYIGFGSLGDHNQAEATTRLALDALERSGMRGVLATGWSGLSENMDMPSTVFRLKSAPHAWLFPRMAAVVHHGGAGTTAAGMRAGVPSIVVTYGNDTLAWGKRVFELGVGPRAIPRKKLSAEALAGAISAARSEAMQKAAAELGGKIRQENGAEDAAREICRVLE